MAETRQINVRVPVDLYERAEAIGDVLGLSIASLVREGLERTIESRRQSKEFQDRKDARLRDLKAL